MKGIEGGEWRAREFGTVTDRRKTDEGVSKQRDWNEGMMSRPQVWRGVRGVARLLFCPTTHKRGTIAFQEPEIGLYYWRIPGRKMRVVGPKVFDYYLGNEPT